MKFLTNASLAGAVILTSATIANTEAATLVEVDGPNLYLAGAIDNGALGADSGGTDIFDGALYAYEQFDLQFTPDVDNVLEATLSDLDPYPFDPIGFQLLEDGIEVAARTGSTGSFVANIMASSSYSIRVYGEENLETGYGLNLGSTSVSEIPVPAAAWLFGSALLGIAGVKRKRRT